MTHSFVLRAKVREFNTLGVVLGYRYEDSPIIVDDGSEPPTGDFRNYIPSAHPGCLAPHAWLDDGSSLYDHFGPGFTLLVTQVVSGPALDRLRDAASAGAIPLKVVKRDWGALAELYEARFTLIRPDQHVAWRGNELPSHAERLLGKIAGQIAT